MSNIVPTVHDDLEDEHVFALDRDAVYVVDARMRWRWPQLHGLWGNRRYSLESRRIPAWLQRIT